MSFILRQWGHSGVSSPRKSTTIFRLHVSDSREVNETAPLEKARANEAVVALLADRTGTDTSSIAVVSGHGSPAKVVAVDGMDDAEIGELPARSGMGFQRRNTTRCESCAATAAPECVPGDRLRHHLLALPNAVCLGEKKAAAPRGGGSRRNHLVGCINGRPVDSPLSAQPSGTVLRH